jgi:hypothetical protein
MKAKLIIVAQLAALTIVHFVCFSAVSAALLSAPAEQPAEPESRILVALLAVSFLNSAVLTYVVRRARWTGAKLVLALFIIFYGVVTVMSQIETAFFITRLPPGMLPRLFLAGAIIAALFSIFAALILGKIRQREPVDRSSWLRQMSLGEWAWKLSLIAIAYVVIYFAFGYFIAWQNEAVRAYYGGSDPGSLFAQMQSVIRDTPFLIPLQILRGLMWTGLALLVVRMMRGQWWEAGLAVALLFSVVMNSQLLIPNPLMPDEVRMTHLVETASSNFLFGWLVVLVLRGRRTQA